MNLTDEQWRKLSLGDTGTDGDLEYKAFVEKYTGHLRSPELYRQFYNVEVAAIPPEYTSGFPLDNRLQAVADIIMKNKCRSLLDVGCKAGFLMFNLLHGGALDRAVGVELNKGWHDLCKAHREANNLNADFHCGLFEEYQTPDRFDCVAVTDVLEHVPDPAGFLRHAAGFLEEAGLLVVSIPVSRPALTEDEKRITLERGFLEHVSLITADNLLGMCRDIGLSRVESVDVDTVWQINISVFEAP